jgi:hypothetical protein
LLNKVFHFFAYSMVLIVKHLIEGCHYSTLFFLSLEMRWMRFRFCSLFKQILSDILPFDGLWFVEFYFLNIGQIVAISNLHKLKNSIIDLFVVMNVEVGKNLKNDI